jgi:hypothetical protein
MLFATTMTSFNTKRQYVAVTVTVPTGVATQLYPLILAAYKALPQPDGASATDLPSTSCRAINIQSDPDISTANVCIGDSNVSATNMGFKLQPNGSFNREAIHDEVISVYDYWAFAASGTIKLNIQLQRG